MRRNIAKCVIDKTNQNYQRNETVDTQIIVRKNNKKRKYDIKLRLSH